MPRGIEISSNTSKIRGAFASYAAANKRNREQLFRQQALKLAVELYNQAAAIAPTEAQIEAKIISLGWRIPTRFSDGRVARGTPKEWLGYDWTVKRAPKRRRGRPTKRSIRAYEAKQAAFYEDYGSRPTLDQMQAWVIQRRVQARLYIASAFNGASTDLGGSVKATSGMVYRDRGGAFISLADGVMSVTIWNRSIGVADVAEKTGFVEKAIEVRVADMFLYVARKEQEARARLRRV